MAAGQAVEDGNLPIFGPFRGVKNGIYPQFMAILLHMNL